MKLSDSRHIALDRPAVWAAILNPEVLVACIPGCQELTGSAEDGFEAVVVQKVGPVKATFKGTVSALDMVDGESLTLDGQGKGGAAGFAKGAAKVRFSDAPEGGTLLEYDVDAKVGGKLAQLGSRIIDGFANKLADQFFENFKNGLEDTDVEEDTGDDDPETSDTEPKKKGWLKRLVSS